MPLGGKLRRVPVADWESSVQEMQYGHSQSKRSGRCFVFILEDKTLHGETFDEEAGSGTGRLFGICVIHPRIMTDTTTHTHTQQQQGGGGTADTHQNSNAQAHALALSQPFEASVCYAFITRFPLFDFFFQVTREPTLKSCKHIYIYNNYRTLTQYTTRTYFLA